MGYCNVDVVDINCKYVSDRHITHELCGICEMY